MHRKADQWQTEESEQREQPGLMQVEFLTGQVLKLLVDRMHRLRRETVLGVLRSSTRKDEYGKPEGGWYAQIAFHCRQQ